MTEMKIVKNIKQTLQQLENNATKCLENNDVEHAKMYLDYATGVRIALDNIELM